MKWLARLRRDASLKAELAAAFAASFAARFAPRFAPRFAARFATGFPATFAARITIGFPATFVARCAAKVDIDSGFQQGAAMVAPARPARRATFGFTLLETLIVLAIVGILAAMVYPSYARQVIKARRTEAQLVLVDTMQRQEQYRAQHHSYLAFSSAASDADSRDFRWWIGADPGSSAYEIDGQACAGQDIRQCIVLRAQPGTARVDSRFRDPDCGVLSFDSTGAQGASGAAPRCWP